MCPYLSFSLFFFLIFQSCTSLCPFIVSSLSFCRSSTCVAPGGRPTVDEHSPIVSVGDEQRLSSCWLSKCTPPPPFWVDSSIVQPHFPVKPPVLERVFNGLQNYTPFASRIIAVEKLVSIHIMPSPAFYGELGQFCEARPFKAWCTLHKLSFDIQIGYVLRTFENHVLRDRIVNLNCLDLRARLTEGQNWESISPLNSFRHHESSGSFGISKRASITKCVFQGKLVALFCVKSLIHRLSGLRLENEHTPDSFWRVESILNSNYYFG